eukprot:364276-Chlamydomonas_euryale.AAC.8
MHGRSGGPRGGAVGQPAGLWRRVAGETGRGNGEADARARGRCPQPTRMPRSRTKHSGAEVGERVASEEASGLPPVPPLPALAGERAALGTGAPRRLRRVDGR